MSNQRTLMLVSFVVSLGCTFPPIEDEAKPGPVASPNYRLLPGAAVSRSEKHSLQWASRGRPTHQGEYRSRWYRLKGAASLKPKE